MGRSSRRFYHSFFYLFASFIILGRLEFAASSVGACELLALPVIVILTVESRETFKLLWVVTSGSGGVDHTTRKAGEWRSLCVWLTVSA